MKPPPQPSFDPALLDTVVILAQSIELRDQATGGHSYRTSIYALLLADHAGLQPCEVGLLRLGAPLHDIGKIGIADTILRKPGALTANEFEAMKLHTVKGAEILNTIPGLRAIFPIVRSHHERWDGQGYPDGLAGESISVLARIVSLAEVFDTMTTDQPYRKARPTSAAFDEIERHAGSQFDPQLASSLLQHADQFGQAWQQHAVPR